MKKYSLNELENFNQKRLDLSNNRITDDEVIALSKNIPTVLQEYLNVVFSNSSNKYLFIFS
jgi:hypothetical protein